MGRGGEGGARSHGEQQLGARDAVGPLAGGAGELFERRPLSRAQRA
jgi:hypothetical protein